MMREILFRGKRLDNGEWVQGYYMTDPLGVVIRTHEIIKNKRGGDTHIEQSYRVDPSSIGQFTGLLDKNGKRVFEGDVVAAEVYRHGSGSNWYSEKNINHGKVPLVNLAVAFGPMHGTHGWIFTDLPCTRQQIEELEKPMGRERNRQSVQRPYTPHNRCVFEVIGTIHEPRGENDGE